MSPDQAIEEINDIINKIRNINGTFISLWHNESLSDKGKWKNY